MKTKNSYTYFPLLYDEKDIIPEGGLSHVQYIEHSRSIEDANERVLFLEDALLQLNNLRAMARQWIKPYNFLLETNEQLIINEIENIQRTAFIKTDTVFTPLLNALNNYGFYKLDKVIKLSTEGQNDLTNMLLNNKLPYCIAMFEYLGFLRHLEKNYFPEKYKLYKEIALWFNSDKDGRTVKGNISSLVRPTERYTAYIHVKDAQNDYHSLK